jgi:hypothetical protein
MTISGDSDAFIIADNQYNPLYQFPPSINDILSRLVGADELAPLDTDEKRFALAVLMIARDAALKAWAADLLFNNQISSISFTDADNKSRKLEIEVLPHGMGRRLYINVYATDDANRKRIFLRAIKYEDESYRRSAYADYFCPIWMKLVGKRSYLSGKVLSFEPDTGITSDELLFDIDGLEIISTRAHSVSPVIIMEELLEPFYEANFSTNYSSYNWNFEKKVNDAINEMNIDERNAYFSGKAYATEFSAEIDKLSDKEKQKFDYYKIIYSDLMMDAVSAEMPFDQRILELEICIRNGLNSIPHQVLTILSKDDSEKGFDSVLSLLVHMESIDIEFAQDKISGPPMRVHLLKVLETFLDETKRDALLETYDNQIGLKSASRWIIYDRISDLKYQLKSDIKALIGQKSETADYIELLSTALADPYFQHFLTVNPVEMQKISKILIEGMGEDDYNRFVKPLLES